MKKVLLAVLLVVMLAVGLAVTLTYPQYRSDIDAARKRAEAGSEIFKAADGELEYAVEGTGTPVLVLHGAGGGYDQGLWYGKMSLGGEGYKFISVSRFGYLRTPIPAGDTVKKQAAMYKELLDYLNVGQVIVVGGSSGGLSAIEFANDFPDRTRALILLSAVSRSGTPDDKAPFYINLINQIQKSDYVYWLITKFMQGAMLDLVGVHTETYENFTPEQKRLAQEMLDKMLPMSQRYRGTVNDSRMIGSYDMPVGNLTAPTLILHAKDDGLVSFAHAENSHEKIKQSQIIAYDTGGHGMLPRMEEVRSAIKEFLKAD